MKNYLFRGFIFAIILTGFSTMGYSQFIADPLQTYFICNAADAQINVSAFGDGNGGTYSFWIDRRNGNAGTAIYGQHLDSVGSPQWSANGKLFFQQNAKEVWLMKAVAWQSGILISWVQGGFGAGGDSLLCNYYNANGVSQWAQPVVVANKQGSIIYVGGDRLEIFPNDSGATISCGLVASGGSDFFNFNRIDFSGNLRWPLDSMYYQGYGSYYRATSDNHNGFFVAASTGGIGAPIYVGHFDLHGNLTIPTPVNVCGTAGGRGNSDWKVICDTDTNAYIVWASNANNDISISKILPGGTLPWPDAKQICAAAGGQERPEVIMKGDTIYAVWEDGRPGVTGNYDVYMQKLDTSGTALWTTDGILISHLPSYTPYPKLAVSGNNIVATYLAGGGFRGQMVRPDSTITWVQNGIMINVNNPPFYSDYQLVPAADGCVSAIWREYSGNDICAARLRPAGILTFVSEPPGSSLLISPNPAADALQIHAVALKSGEIRIIIYNITGERVYYSVEKNSAGEFSGTIPVSEFSNGVYLIRVETAAGVETGKFVVEK